MRKRGLAGRNRASPADEPRTGDRVMRGTKGPDAAREGVERQRADGVYEHGLEPSLVIQLGQYGRHPPRQHGLAGTRRPHHEQAMPACGGHHEGALGRLLVNDVLVVEPRLGARARRLMENVALGAVELGDAEPQLR